MPVDPRALGFESEEVLVAALRALFGIPDECSVALYAEMANGAPVFTLVVTGQGGAHTVADAEPE